MNWILKLPLYLIYIIYYTILHYILIFLKYINTLCYILYIFGILCIIDSKKLCFRFRSKTKTANGDKIKAEPSQRSADELNNENQKIQIGDIESILSHLHGT